MDPDVTDPPAEPRPSLPTLRSALIRAAERNHLDAARHQHHPVAWRRPRLLPGLALAVAAGGLIVLLVMTASLIIGADPVAADVTVTRSGDEWVVRIHDASTTPEAVEAALRAEGLRASVNGVAVGPSRVGEFVNTGGALLEGPDPTSSDSIRVPVTAGAVALMVGRPAEPGESYLAPSDAYADDEPLECSGLWGLPAPDAVPELRRRVGQVELVRADGQPASEPPEEGFVTDAVMTSADSVRVYISDEAASPFREPLSNGSAQCPVGRGR